LTTLSKTGILQAMVSILPSKKGGKILGNPHFWAIVTITLALIVLYQSWPWRDNSIEQWFPWIYQLAVAEFVNHIVGVLFLIPIIYAAVVFSWQGAIVACFLSLAGVLPVVAGMWTNYYLVTNVAFLLLPFLLVSLATFELEWRRKEKKIFIEREAERKVFISKILDSQENERLRIAQELHDDTIQTLLVIANRAQSLVNCCSADMGEAKLIAGWIRDTTLETVDGLRRISLDLRPSILSDLGLVPALRWLVDRINTESGINTRIFESGKERKLTPEAEITIFRITQEALNNIKRHSRATEATVTLEFTPEHLKIAIEDNGQGFRPPRKFDRLASKGKLGLIGMQQRIDFLGGTFKINSKRGEGTMLLIETRC